MSDCLDSIRTRFLDGAPAKAHVELDLFLDGAACVSDVLTLGRTDPGCSPLAGLVVPEESTALRATFGLRSGLDDAAFADRWRCAAGRADSLMHPVRPLALVRNLFVGELSPDGVTTEPVTASLVLDLSRLDLDHVSTLVHPRCQVCAVPESVVRRTRAFRDIGVRYDWRAGYLPFGMLPLELSAFVLVEAIDHVDGRRDAA